jgi:hypothetical protein
MPNHLYKPASALLEVSKHDAWTLDDAFMGTFICGGTGSGKSSGSGRSIAHAFLRAGFGGLVLCAKPDEADVWRRYCKETGREASLVVLGGKGDKCFNFLEYELARIDGGSSSTNFALEALLKVYEAMQIADGVKGDESFWRNSVRLLLSHSIDALYVAYGRLRFPELMAFIRSMAMNSKQFDDSQWRANSFHFQTMEQAARNIKTEEVKATLKVVASYFMGLYDLDSKTKSNIFATLEAMVMDFQKGDLARIFCTNTNIVPEMSHHGAVIVLDFPLKIWQRGGQLAQHIFKYAWQRAVERRPIEEQTRPCFLWADEYQLFASSYDAEFQSTARSSRTCTVYMSQSVPALREAVKSTIPKETIDALLNNFQTTIIHTCKDPTTQTWAAELIGKGLQWRHNETYSTSQGVNWGQSSGSSSGRSSGASSSTGDGTSTNSSNGRSGGFFDGVNNNSSGGGRNRNYSHGNNTGTNEGINQGASSGNSQGYNEGVSRQETMDYHVQPSFFGTALRMGGERNKFLVDGVIMQGGRVWKHNDSTWLLCTFSQK